MTTDNEYYSNGYSVNKNILFKGILFRGLSLYRYSAKKSLTEKSDIVNPYYPYKCQWKSHCTTINKSEKPHHCFHDSSIFCALRTLDLVYKDCTH